MFAFSYYVKTVIYINLFMSINKINLKKKFLIYTFYT